MIKSFKDKATRDITAGVFSKESRKILPVELHKRARRLIAEIDFASALSDLSRKSNRFHSLKGDRKGQYSVSINDQYRICFRWEQKAVFEVEIIDYH